MNAGAPYQEAHDPVDGSRGRHAGGQVTADHVIA